MSWIELHEITRHPGDKAERTAQGLAIYSAEARANLCVRLVTMRVCAATRPADSPLPGSRDFQALETNSLLPRRDDIGAVDAQKLA
jgi:hypothetical protein